MVQTQYRETAQKRVGSSFGMVTEATQVLWFGDLGANREVMRQG